MVPTDDALDGAHNREALLTVYQHICGSHNAIAEFRAKLLALLPIASGTGLFLLLRQKADDLNVPMLFPIGLFGFIVVFGLFLYELRGIDDCVLLRRRAGEIERLLEVGIEIGQFAGRGPGKFGFVDEIGAGWIVYNAVMAAWLFVAGYGVVGTGGLLGHGANTWVAPFGGVLCGVFVCVLLASPPGRAALARLRKRRRDP
jgi:hypothetical protein